MVGVFACSDVLPMGFGPWTLDLGLWTLDFGLWTLEVGLFFELHRQRVLVGIPSDPIEFEIIRPAAIHSRNQIEHIMPVVVRRTQRRPSVLCCEKLIGFRRFAHSLVRINFGANRMSYGD